MLTAVLNMRIMIAITNSAVYGMRYTATAKEYKRLCHYDVIEP